MSLIGYYCGSGLERLARSALKLGENWETDIAEHLDHFVFLKELENAGTEVVKVRSQSSQINSTGIGLQSIEDAWAECGWMVERDEGGTLTIDAESAMLLLRAWDERFGARTR